MKLLSLEVELVCSNLRKHLMKEHLEDWVKACSEKKIDITAAAALKHINEIQGNGTLLLLLPPSSPFWVGDGFELSVHQGFCDHLADTLTKPLNSCQCHERVYLLRR